MEATSSLGGPGNIAWPASSSHVPLPCPRWRFQGHVGPLTLSWLPASRPGKVTAMPATPLPVPQTLPPRVPASSGSHAHPPPRTAGRWPPQLSLSPRSHQAQQSCFWAPGRWCRRGHRQPLRPPRPPLPSAVVGGAESTLQQRASRRGDGVFGQRGSAFPTLAEDQNASTLGREEWRSHWDRGSKAHSRGSRTRGGHTFQSRPPGASARSTPLAALTGSTATC